MRAREFIVEYKRDITSRQFGPALLRLIKDRKHPDNSTIVPPLVPGVSGPNHDEKILNLLFRHFEEGDPTYDGERGGIYVPWIAREYANGNIRRLEDIDSRVKPLLAQYHQYKNKGWFPQHAKDIMRVNIHQLSSLMVNLNVPQDRQVDRGEYSEIYKDSSVRVIVPKDVTAACYYGQGTQWCTASTRGTNYFDQYNKQGPLYIILPANPEHLGEKYQFHFESGQFMNERDEPINPKEIIVTRFPQLYEVFKSKVENLLEFASDEFVKRLYDTALELATDYFEKTLLEAIKNNRHYEYMDWLSARGVDVDRMTSSDLERYERKRGYSFGEFDPNVVEIDDILHEMRAVKIDQIREYTRDIQSMYATLFNPSDIGEILATAFSEIFSKMSNHNVSGGYSNSMHNFMEDDITAKSEDYQWERGMREFKPYKKVGEWTVGTYSHQRFVQR